MIEAYFDESAREDGTFCVAGYCFFPKEVRKIERKWRKIMGDRIFHATDMNCGGGKFKDLDQDTGKKMYSDLIAAITEHAAFGIAASINPNEVSSKWPDLDGFRTAYAVCCAQIVGRISTYLDDEGITSRVAYIFEAGHKHEAEASRYMASIARSELRKARFHYLSHTFVGKGDMVLLQTADLLAWEWSKCESETGFPQRKENPKRPMRESLKRLLFTRPERSCVGHLRGATMDKHFLEIEDVLREVRER